MDIRFVKGTNRDDPRDLHGVFVELRLLRDSGVLPAYEVEHANELFDQLAAILPVPPFGKNDWGRDAISWFKVSAKEVISDCRAIVSILEQFGKPVRTITTSQPGEILYEDEYQVVARSERF